MAIMMPIMRSSIAPTALITPEDNDLMTSLTPGKMELVRKSSNSAEYSSKTANTSSLLNISYLSGMVLT